MRPAVVAGVRVREGDNSLCLACHGRSRWYWAVRGRSYPSVSSPLRDRLGYPVDGTFPGVSVYSSAGANPHSLIPASRRGLARAKGDCLWCHDPHPDRATRDALRGRLYAPTTATLVADRARGTYAEACLACHDGSRARDGATDVSPFVLASAGGSVTAGHSVLTSGGTLPVGAPLPCYECHAPHGSALGNHSLLSDHLGAWLDPSSGPHGVRRMCLTCHTSADEALGWDSRTCTYAVVPTSAVVVGLRRDGGAATSTPNALRLSDMSGHRSVDTTSCEWCHGDGYAAGDHNVHAPAIGAEASRTPSVAATPGVIATGAPEPSS